MKKSTFEIIFYVYFLEQNIEVWGWLRKFILWAISQPSSPVQNLIIDIDCLWSECRNVCNGIAMVYLLYMHCSWENK